MANQLNDLVFASGLAAFDANLRLGDSSARPGKPGGVSDQSIFGRRPREARTPLLGISERRASDRGRLGVEPFATPRVFLAHFARVAANLNLGRREAL